MYLDYIGHAEEPKPQRAHGNATLDSYTPAPFALSSVGAPVQNVAFGSEAVIGPLPLDMDERALSRAVEHMLQGRNRHQFVFSDWFDFRHFHQFRSDL